MSDLILRPVTLADRPKVLALFAEHLDALGYRPDPDLDHDMDEFPRAYATPPDAFIVATETEGEIVAMGGLLNGEVRRLYVRPGARRRGAAQKIVRRLVMGAAESFAIVDRANIPAHASLRACGFVPTGRTPDHPKMERCEIWELEARC